MSSKGKSSDDSSDSSSENDASDPASKRNLPQQQKYL